MLEGKNQRSCKWVNGTTRPIALVLQVVVERSVGPGDVVECLESFMILTDINDNVHIPIRAINKM